jgi:hypothetical protein
MTFHENHTSITNLAKLPNHFVETKSHHLASALTCVDTCFDCLFVNNSLFAICIGIDPWVIAAWAGLF